MPGEDSESLELQGFPRSAIETRTREEHTHTHSHTSVLKLNFLGRASGYGPTVSSFLCSEHLPKPWTPKPASTIMLASPYPTLPWLGSIFCTVVSESQDLGHC